MEAGYKDKATLREIANGALLHDVGKSALDPAVINKREARSAAECARCRNMRNKARRLCRNRVHLAKSPSTSSPTTTEKSLTAQDTRTNWKAIRFPPSCASSPLQTSSAWLRLHRVTSEGPQHPRIVVEFMNGEMRHELDSAPLAPLMTMTGPCSQQVGSHST